VTQEAYFLSFEERESMARKWWPFPIAWRSTTVDPERELQVLIERFRQLLPHLDAILVRSRARSIKIEIYLLDIYSTNEGRGTLQEAQFQEKLHRLIEDWRTVDLVFQVCAFRVNLIKAQFREAIDLRYEAIQAGRDAHQLSQEQEALCRMSVKDIKLTDLAESVRRAVDSRSLDDYFKALGYSELPSEISVVMHRTYEEYIEIIVNLVAEDRRKKALALAKKRNNVALLTSAAQNPQLTRPSANKPRQPRLTPTKVEASKEKSMESSKPRVFLIHGHDQLALTKAEALLHRIVCQPVIFSRIPDKATKTNVEILEKHLPSCDAVVVLLTPDDEGRKKGTEVLEPRARQNVLVEAGFAIISRRATSLIVALGEVSIPSDFDGINRIQASIWNRETDINLARELGNMLGLSLDVSQL